MMVSLCALSRRLQATLDSLFESRQYFSMPVSRVKPTPPAHSMALPAASWATTDEYHFAIAASFVKFLPSSFIRDALYVRSLAASILVWTSANWNAMPWNSPTGLPNCFLWYAYATDLSNAPWARPTIWAAMPIRPSLRISIAIL